MNKLPILSTSYQCFVENRVVNVATIARETGLSRLIVGSWLKNEVKGFGEETIAAFCGYFECGISDLLTLENDENDL